MVLRKRTLAALALMIAASMARPGAAQTECDASCPVPCMFGLCPTIDAAPNPPGGERPKGCSEATVARLWPEAKAANDCLAYETFREACPNTPEARFAASAMRRLNCPLTRGASPAGGRPAVEPAAASSVRPGQTFRDCDVCPEMVAIPGGRFTMGSPADEPERNSDEGPQRTVRIALFAMGAAEVSFAEWDACVADGGCGGYRPEDRGWGRGDRPVINVSWEDAQAYVAWLNSKVSGAPYRLPSEAEWEYAARAGTTTRYSWGDGWSGSRANNNGSKTVEVGSYAPNAFGLYDVHGNVWEWVEDCWNTSYSGAPSDGSAWKSRDCSRTVLRGGSWLINPRLLRSANRLWNRRGNRDIDVGFRVARTLVDDYSTSLVPTALPQRSCKAGSLLTLRTGSKKR